MTTVATDGRSMAGDGMITENDRICMLDYPKVRRLKDGRLVGFSGNAYNWDAYAEWLETTPPAEVPKVHETFSCLVLNVDGSACSYDELGRRFPEVSPAAIGSGADLAVAAMDAGKSAADAVQIACGRDIHSGGVVTVLALEDTLRAVA